MATKKIKIDIYTLKMLRKLVGLTQKELAEKIGISLSFYKKWEQTHIINIQPYLLEELSACFAIPPKELQVILRPGGETLRSRRNNILLALGKSNDRDSLIRVAEMALHQRSVAELEILLEMSDWMDSTQKAACLEGYTLRETNRGFPLISQSQTMASIAFVGYLQKRLRDIGQVVEYEGKNWLCITVKDFTEEFQIRDEGNLRVAINKLVESGVVERIKAPDFAKSHRMYYTINRARLYEVGPIIRRKIIAAKVPQEEVES